MNFKLVAAILAVLVIAETAYILVNRRSANRFQSVTVEKWEGLLALDTETGTLCKTLAQATLKNLAATAPKPFPPPRKQPSASQPPAPHTDVKPDDSEDPLVAAFQKELEAMPPSGPSKEEVEEEDQARFLRSLPFCWQLH